VLPPVIQLDHMLEPIAAIGLKDGKAMVDPQELADYENYVHLRQAVLLYPAMLPPEACPP